MTETHYLTFKTIAMYIGILRSLSRTLYTPRVLSKTADFTSYQYAYYSHFYSAQRV